MPYRAGVASFADPAVSALVLPVGGDAVFTPQFFDADGVAITGTHPSYTSANTRVAGIDARGRVSARTPGDAEIAADLGGARSRMVVRVVAAPRDEGDIDVFSSLPQQQISGWEVVAQIGQNGCHPIALERYRREVLARAVNELGITRVRLELRSGTERPDDDWFDRATGEMKGPNPRGYSTRTINDNDDPFVVEPSGFQWAALDRDVDYVVSPLRELMSRRGERLFITLTFVDFWSGWSKPFPLLKLPEEFAELIRATFDHMNARVGYVPDAVELNLEPEHTPYSGLDMGRALMAVDRRLQAGGYQVAFVAPSTTKASNAVRDYDHMVRVPGVRGRVAEIAYHKYAGVSDPTLRMLKLRARRDGARTAMLEHIGSGFDGLYRDLVVANASSWQQFGLAFCSGRDEPDSPGVYYQVNEADPEHPRLTMTNDAWLLRQVFAWVRPGATRLETVAAASVIRSLAFRNATGPLVVIARTRRAMELRVHGLPRAAWGATFSDGERKINAGALSVDQAANGVVVVPVPGHGVVAIHAR